MGAGRFLVAGSSPSQDRALECGSWGNSGSGRGDSPPRGGDAQVPERKHGSRGMRVRVPEEWVPGKGCGEQRPPQPHGPRVGATPPDAQRRTPAPCAHLSGPHRGRRQPKRRRRRKARAPARSAPIPPQPAAPPPRAHGHDPAGGARAPAPAAPGPPPPLPPPPAQSCSSQSGRAGARRGVGVGRVRAPGSGRSLACRGGEEAGAAAGGSPQPCPPPPHCLGELRCSVGALLEPMSAVSAPRCETTGSCPGAGKGGSSPRGFRGSRSAPGSGAAPGSKDARGFRDVAGLTAVLRSKDVWC